MTGAQTGNEFKLTADQGDGFPALPGKYSVSLEMDHNGTLSQLAGPVDFNCVVLNQSSLKDQDSKQMISFMKEIYDLWLKIDGTEKFTNEMKNRNNNIRQSLQLSNENTAALLQKTTEVDHQLKDILFTFNGSPVKASFEEVPPEQVSVNYRLGAIFEACWSTLTEPTATMKMNYDIILKQIPTLSQQLKSIDAALSQIESKMDEMKLPYTPGRLPIIN